MIANVLIRIRNQKYIATSSRGRKPCLFNIFFKFLVINIVTSTYYQNLDHERAIVVHLTNSLYPLGSNNVFHLSLIWTFQGRLKWILNPPYSSIPGRIREAQLENIIITTTTIIIVARFGWFKYSGQPGLVVLSEQPICFINHLTPQTKEKHRS